ncbi:MAG: hypothetical protein IKF14_10720 [Atopobiaceae bacterium]|nr:hypothetical protein [Atopobiaceae bacterium]
MWPRNRRTLRFKRKRSFRDDSYRNSYHPSATIHEDFEQLPPDARAKLQFVGDGDPLYRELEPLS